MKFFIQYGAKIRMDGPALGRKGKGNRLGLVNSGIGSGS